MAPTLDDAARAVIILAICQRLDAFAGERSAEVVAMVGSMLDALERVPSVRL